MFKYFDRVKLISDTYVNDGAHQGDIGTIVEIYGKGMHYEVQFFSKLGIMGEVVLTIKASDLALATKNEITEAKKKYNL